MRMHEGPLVRDLIASAVAVAEEHGGSQVAEVTIVVGDLTGIDDESVRSHFVSMSAGTPAAGATVTVRRSPATAVCFNCTGSFEATSADEPLCPTCGSLQVRVSPGPQPFVESVQLGAKTN
jgi:hydrogenase nickel incorporation protein HypA/HybF